MHVSSRQFHRYSDVLVMFDGYIYTCKCIMLKARQTESVKEAKDKGLQSGE